MPRIHVEAWDPDFGAAFSPEEMTLSRAEVDPSVEAPVASWNPIGLRARAPIARSVVFIDGVRRVDALIWIEGSRGAVHRGLCASYAAGAVAAGFDRRAVIREAMIRRAFFSTVADVSSLATDAGTYVATGASGQSAASLSSDLQESLRRLEAEVALSERELDLLVIDGPLSAHHVREKAVGYVKSHRVSYLPPELTDVVQRLEPFERTPLFRTTTSWTRLSTYLRVGGDRTHPFSGIVRLEFSADASLTESQRLANLAAATLPRYASVPHKDPRAPQNLFPIGGLERELRRRLGNPALLHRALKAAAARDFAAAPGAR